MTKPDKFLGCLVVRTKISFGIGCRNYMFSGIWIFSIWGSILVENHTKVDIWLTLGVPGAPSGGLGAGLDFIDFSWYSGDRKILSRAGVEGK